MIKEVRLRSAILLYLFLTIPIIVYSQKSDTTLVVNNFKTVVSVTNNGISLIPTFSLGKPAVIFDASVGRRITFDPMIRYSLEGQPWSFIFWWRYKLLKPGRFQMTLGAHPSVLFRNKTDTVDGVSHEYLVATRYLVAELFPNYMLTRNIYIGLYYNYSRGLGDNNIRNTHFLTVRTGFSNVKLTDKLFINITPQFYYLKMDDLDGFYFTTALTLASKNLPFSISSVINKTIDSEIVSKDFVWNVTLNYTINRVYVAHGN
jgi:hypothetical protein